METTPEPISEAATIELRTRLEKGAALREMDIIQHQPLRIKHGKWKQGLDISGLKPGLGPVRFRDKTVKPVKYFGIFGPGIEHSQKNAIGCARLVHVCSPRTLTAARNAPEVVGRLVVNDDTEIESKFGWVEERVYFGLLKKAFGNEIHGHAFFPYLVMKLQRLVGHLPLAYHSDLFVEGITFLDHEAFQQSAGLSRVFLLLYWAGMAEKKILFTRQSDGTDYGFSYYATSPEAIRQAGFLQ